MTQYTWSEILKEAGIKLISIPLSVKVQLLTLSTILLLTDRLNQDNWTKIVLGIAVARVGISMLGMWKNNENDFKK